MRFCYSANIFVVLAAVSSRYFLQTTTLSLSVLGALNAGPK